MAHAYKSADIMFFQPQLHPMKGSLSGLEM